MKRVLILVIKFSAVSPSLQQDHSHLFRISKCLAMIHRLSLKLIRYSPPCAHMLPQYAVGLISGKTQLRIQVNCEKQPAYLDNPGRCPATSPGTRPPLQARIHLSEGSKDHLQVASHRSVVKRLQWIVVRLVWYFFFFCLVWHCSRIIIGQPLPSLTLVMHAFFSSTSSRTVSKPGSSAP